MTSAAPASLDPNAEVLVVGAGPTGLCLANLLGTYGVRTLVIEREAEGYTYPRAVGIDDESLRTCQAFGLVNEVLADVLENMPIRYHSSTGRCLAHVKPSAKPFGWARRNLFLQPIFEATLRRGLDRFDTVEVRNDTNLVAYEQDATGVSAVVEGTNGESSTLRASFLVGADGGRSTVRGLSGIELTGQTAADRWLVVDVADDELDAPYSGVYCDPVQPVLMVPLPYRHRRFEFKLAASDIESEVTEPERILRRLALRYGKTPLPTIVRARVYTHHSRIAERFRAGRVFLAGDAAHLQPPFFGQGMNSGLRDATNLAWKLTAVARSQANEPVLDSYDEERRGHATAMVEFATRMGKLYTPRNRVTESLRDAAFRAIQLIPGARDYILQMKYKPMPRYENGIVVSGDSRRKARTDPVGKMFMQPMIEAEGGRRQLLDQSIGPWFAVLGIGVDPTEHMSAGSQAWWKDVGARIIHIVPPRSGLPRSEMGTTITLEDVDGAFRDWRLAAPEDEIIVLRPDRYVAAVCNRGGFEEATNALRQRMGDSQRAR
jgi:3-(3-hydroxy-phenyl)propionate hydroxylase